MARIQPDLSGGAPSDASGRQIQQRAFSLRGSLKLGCVGARSVGRVGKTVGLGVSQARVIQLFLTAACPGVC